MEGPPLKLVIVKGPREGETVEFRPGSTVRIGRVVRTNNLAIKDPGVSSKHLTITWDPNSRNWVVQDLESSNGTFLNSSNIPIPPFEPVPIRDKDTLKLGEETSMVVVIEKAEEVEETGRRLRPRSDKTEKGRGGRARTKKENVIVEKEVVPIVEEKEEDVGVSEVVPIVEEKEEDVGVSNQPGKGKGGRGRPKKAKVEEEEDVGVSNQPGKGKGGGGRGRPKKAKVEEEEEVEVAGTSNVQVTSESNVRVTRSRKNLRLVSGGGNGVGVEVGRRTRAGARKRVNLSELPPQSEEEEKEMEREGEGEKNQCDSNQVVVIKEEKVEFGSIFRGGTRTEDKGKVVELGSGSGGEGEQEKGKGSMENEGEVGGAGDLGEERNEAGFNWENGTLGEWFDYMEAWLRKQVMDESEALIDEMRKKAKRVKEYQIQMELRKCKGDVVTGC